MRKRKLKKGRVLFILLIGALVGLGALASCKNPMNKPPVNNTDDDVPGDDVTDDDVTPGDDDDDVTPGDDDDDVTPGDDDDDVTPGDDDDVTPGDDDDDVTPGDDDDDVTPGDDDDDEPPAMVELLAILPAGSTATFTMGSDSAQAGSGPEREVTLTRPYAMSKYEITLTQAVNTYQWAWDHGLVTLQSGKFYDVASGLVLFATDDQGHVGHHGNTIYAKNAYSKRPVNEIRWFGAAMFCNFLSMMEGLEPAYDENWVCDPGKTGYRLPSEAEWEYAARGTDGRLYPWGGDFRSNRVNYFGSNDPWEPRYDGTGLTGFPCTPVGFYNGQTMYHYVTGDGASPFGLYDMVGNIGEFVNDWYADYSDDPVQDPRGPAWGRNKVVKGGSWKDGADLSTVTSRIPVTTIVDLDNVGFRIARTLFE